MGNENRYNEWLAGVCELIYHRRITTQSALARKTGAAREHINAVLRGRTDAGTVLQDKITDALGYSYDELRAMGRAGAVGGNAAQESAYYAVVNAYLRMLADFWGQEHGRDEHSAFALTAALDQAFPQLLGWREGKIIIKNAEAGWVAPQLGVLSTNEPQPQMEEMK